MSEPPRRPAELSRLHQRERIAKGEKVTYTTQRTPTGCDECFALQHEDRLIGSRAVARTSRKRKTGNTLHLCAAHTELWKQLDGETT